MSVEHSKFFACSNYIHKFSLEFNIGKKTFVELLYECTDPALEESSSLAQNAVKKCRTLAVWTYFTVQSECQFHVYLLVILFGSKNFLYREIIDLLATMFAILNGLLE